MPMVKVYKTKNHPPPFLVFFWFGLWVFICDRGSEKTHKKQIVSPKPAPATLPTQKPANPGYLVCQVPTTPHPILIFFFDTLCRVWVGQPSKPTGKKGPNRPKEPQLETIEKTLLARKVWDLGWKNSKPQNWEGGKKIERKGTPGWVLTRVAGSK